MDFLDELISDDQFSSSVIDQGLLGRIEVLIWHSSLDENQKARKLKEMLKLQSNDDAYKMLAFLQDFQPIIGIHRAPMTQYESVEATRIRVDIENFKERGKERIQR